MTLPEATVIAGWLMLRYPREGNPDVIAAYASDIADLDREQTFEACRQLVRTCHFLPSVAEIHEAVGAIRRKAREQRETRAILDAPAPSAEEQQRMKQQVTDLLTKLGHPLDTIAKPMPESDVTKRKAMSESDLTERRRVLREQLERLKVDGKA